MGAGSSTFDDQVAGGPDIESRSVSELMTSSPVRLSGCERTHGFARPFVCR